MAGSSRSLRRILTVAQSGAVQASRGSIIKVRGIAPSCSRQVEGSGFVYGAQRVMTNAHVVAGVQSPRVVLGASQLPARVVLFDPDRDVAVLAVPDLDRPALAFSAPAAPGANAIVAGYPEDGPFSAVPARVRNRQFARGPDIYSQGTVTRDIYAVRAKVLPGNSGGPLLATDGRVYGVVFAAATDDADTGYALTASRSGCGRGFGAAGTGGGQHGRLRLRGRRGHAVMTVRGGVARRFPPQPGRDHRSRGSHARRVSRGACGGARRAGGDVVGERRRLRPAGPPRRFRKASRSPQRAGRPLR